MVPLEPHYKGMNNSVHIQNINSFLFMSSKIKANTSLNISKIKEMKNFSSDAEFARFLGVTPAVLSRWRTRNTYDIDKIVDAIPNISIPWLLTGEGEMLRTAEEKAEEKPHRIESNVRPVLEGEREWVEIPLVPYRARAGVLSGFGDPDWQEGKQTMPVLIDRRLSGDYLLFEVEGDSMDDGSSTSFLEGDVLLCRVCPRGDWQYGIKRRGDTYCVVATDAEGIALKMITKHDKSENTITCHSLNSIYDDYIVSLSDVKGIFYVEELVKRRY